MKEILFIATLALVITAFSGNGMAQTVSPEKMKLVQELVQVLGSKEDMEKSFDMMTSMQDEIAVKTINEMFDRDKTLSPKDREMMKEIARSTATRINQRLTEFFKQEIDFGKLADEMLTGFYSKNFSEEELRTMIAFYSSPAGKKSNALAPELMKDTMTLVSEKLLPKMSTFVDMISKEEFEKIRTEVMAKTAKPKPRKKPAS